MFTLPRRVTITCNRGCSRNSTSGTSTTWRRSSCRSCNRPPFEQRLMWWGRVARRAVAPKIAVFTCTLFYSSFRLHARIDTPAPAKPTVRLLIDGAAPMQQAECRRLEDGLAHEIIIDALIDPDRFPGNGYVEMKLGSSVERLTLEKLLIAAKVEN